VSRWERRGRALWADFLWYVDSRHYIGNFWDEKVMKSPTRKLDLTMRGDSLRRILNFSHGLGFDRHPPYENARSGSPAKPCAVGTERTSGIKRIYGAALVLTSCPLSLLLNFSRLC
jgi:hypothetical protein